MLTKAERDEAKRIVAGWYASIENPALPPAFLHGADVRKVQEALADLDAKDEEIATLLSEVREWICESCNQAYPGPPQDGLACVICPRCGGNTMPRSTYETRRRDAEIALLVEACEIGAKWMRWWLDLNECECEGSHTCGRMEREVELRNMEAAILRTGRSYLNWLQKYRGQIPSSSSIHPYSKYWTVHRKAGMDLFVGDAFGLLALDENNAWVVANWEKRQPSDPTNNERQRRFKGKKKAGNTDGNATGNGGITATDTDTDKNTYTMAFETWWSGYRRKDNKAGTFAKWKSLIKKGVSEGELLTARDNYMAKRRDDDPDYDMYASTFLGPQKRWREYLDTSPTVSKKPFVPKVDEVALLLAKLDEERAKGVQ